FEGEVHNVALWQQLAAQAASGTISDASLATQFERDIVPFWQKAAERLHRETAPKRADQKAFAALLLDYTDSRLRWAQSIVKVTRSHDSAGVDGVLGLARQTDLALARVERLQLRDNAIHRQRALSSYSLGTELRALFARDRACVERPADFGTPVAAGDAPADGPAARRTVGCRSQKLLLNGNYAELDALMTQAMHHLGDLPDGSSTLSGIVTGLDTLFYFGGFDLNTLLTYTANWRRAVPGSVHADLMECIAFRDWAWSARGHGAADEVTQQSWQVFAHRVEMAAAGLRELLSRGGDDAAWYEYAVDVALDQAAGAEVVQSTFESGAAKFPAYWALYASMLRTLMPRWGGSYEQVDAFINRMAYGHNSSRDLETYARLYWIYQTLERDDVDIFEDTKALWSNMKSGFGRMEYSYPKSDLVHNALVRFACQAGDAAEYRRARASVHYSATAWSPKVSMESCDKKFLTAAR
ncbi:MAG: DUF4034 domain-containing protein, partial [Gammaproteobacteria bacterium]|nr:DUF4034 domain-containing protein [Gammaproteobacteria bacterium]